MAQKKLKPRVKFNGGKGAILCHSCSVIIKEGLSEEEFLGNSDLLFCEKCKKGIS